MGQTIAEKIFSAHSKKKVFANEFVLFEPDVKICHEGSGAVTIKTLNDLGIESIKYPESICFVFDHSSPAPSIALAQRIQFVRDFVNRHQCNLYDVGDGVIHHIVAEQGHFRPGHVVIGGDSHTCTAGALNLFATGVGATDLALAMGSGKMWYRVPSTIRIRLNGKLSEGVSAKDLILHLVKKLGVSGATYKCLEFEGELLDSLGMDARFTISNMAIEMGAKAGVFRGDDITRRWFEQRGMNDVEFVSPDPDAVYADTIEIDASQIEPLVTGPHSIDISEPVDHFINTEISLAVIGTCTNGRLDDLREAAKILKGKRVNPNVNLLIVPASRKVLLDAMGEGLMEIFLNSGAVVMPPGCGPCSGNNPGVPGDKQNVISTSSRNYKGRMGNPESSIYLASPATVAASAIAGSITDPRKTYSEVH